MIQLKGGIGIKLSVLGSDYTLLIPNDGLISTVDTLFAKLDEEVLADPAELDTIIGGLIEELVSIPVSMDGETEKTLLDYANYIYQSHLGGEDSSEQPAWVTQATANVESGEVLGTVLAEETIVYVSNVAGNVCNNLKVSDLLGADVWNTKDKAFVAQEGRTPLIDPLDSGDLINILFGFLGLQWTPSGQAETSLDHTVKELLTDLNGSMVGGMVFDEEIDPDSFLSDTVEGLLNNLLIGTPEEPGIIDEELKGEINGWLLNLVISMGTDSNYPGRQQYHNYCRMEAADGPDCPGCGDCSGRGNGSESIYRRICTGSDRGSGCGECASSGCIPGRDGRGSTGAE